jgi:glucose-6-phosphate isomerase
MRHAVASRFKVMSCLEVGPRYLHSTGQLQKGGSGKGVYLVISAGELKDIELEGEKAQSLGQLSKAQAVGDHAILKERGRRCLHLHLPDNTGITLRCFSNVLMQVVDELGA